MASCIFFDRSLTAHPDRYESLIARLDWCMRVPRVQLIATRRAREVTNDQELQPARDQDTRAADRECYCRTHRHFQPGAFTFGLVSVSVLRLRGCNLTSRCPFRVFQQSQGRRFLSIICGPRIDGHSTAKSLPALHISALVAGRTHPGGLL